MSDTLVNISLLAISMATFGYLTFTLLFPERF